MDTIDDLAPNSTYCFKVQANLPLEGKQGWFSPISCVKTTQKGTQQVRISAEVPSIQLAHSQCLGTSETGRRAKFLLSLVLKK